MALVADSSVLSSEVLRHTSEPAVLENGDRLPAAEFLRRFDTMPDVKKAELIQGIVYMPSPVRAPQHGDPDSLMQTWLGNYAIATPGVKSSTNATAKLGPEDVPQPDGMLRIEQEHGGQCRVDENGILSGAPELVVEVAASSASLDANAKKTSYLRAGVTEYIVWRTLDRAIDWWILEEDEFRPLAAGEDGIWRSLAMAGLWLDSTAMITQEGARVMEVLQMGIASPEHAAFFERLQG